MININANPEIDFQKINPRHGSKSTAFEDLVCDLAEYWIERKYKNECFNKESFIRFNGKGGDGGIEAYYKTASNLKISFQAKYFTNLSGNISSLLQQCDNSIKTASNIHPDIDVYVFAFPVDLTGPRNQKSSQSSQRERFNAKVIEWKKLPWHKEIEVVLLTEQDLRELLLKKNSQCNELIHYYFGLRPLTLSLLKETFNEEYATYENEYDFESHVHVHHEEIINAIARSNEFTNDLYRAIANVELSIFTMRNLYAVNKINPDVIIHKSLTDIELISYQLLKGYDPVLMSDLPEDDCPEHGKLYVELIENRLKYKFLDGNKHIDQEISLQPDDFRNFIKPNESNIADIQCKKGILDILFIKGQHLPRDVDYSQISSESHFNKITKIYDTIFNYTSSLTMMDKKKLIEDEIFYLQTTLIPSIEYLIELLNRSSDSFGMILGPPGSGKTHLLLKKTKELLSDTHPAIFIDAKKIVGDNLVTALNNTISKLFNNENYSLDYLNIFASHYQFYGNTLAKHCFRLLICIDGINNASNTGALWLKQLSNLLDKVNGYPYLSCIISCRSDYPNMSEILKNKKAKLIRLNGFETPEEIQNSEIIFFDRKDIPRFHSPLFGTGLQNPFFLKTISTAIEKQYDKNIGSILPSYTEIMEYYFKNIIADIDGIQNDDFSYHQIVLKFINDLALKMLNNEYNGVKEADVLSMSSYKNLPSNNKNEEWLTTLIKCRLLKISKTNEYSTISFLFEKYEDYIISKALVNISHDSVAYKQQPDVSSGVLAKLYRFFAWLLYITSACTKSLKYTTRFINYKSFSSIFDNTNYYRILLPLSIILPEDIGVELQDLLPKNKNTLPVKDMLEVFLNSLIYRKTGSKCFTDRTKQILHEYMHYFQDDVFNLLTSIAISTDNPLNADYLHNEILTREFLSERDSRWSSWVNRQLIDSENPVAYLINLGLDRKQFSNYNNKTIRLLSLILCWFLSATNRKIRDRSTKALTNLFLFRDSLFLELLNKFKNTDDLYILERLLASGYGACCIDRSENRLRSYSEKVFNIIFKEQSPPLNLLLRDYARGIIELAYYSDTINTDISIDLCTPPYNSPYANTPVISKNKLTKKAETIGGKDVFDLVTSEISDFSKVHIEPFLNSFSTNPLSCETNLTPHQRFIQFKNEVIKTCRLKMKVFTHLERISNPFLYDPSIFPDIEIFTKEQCSTDSNIKKPTNNDKAVDKWLNDLSDAEETLFRHLNENERTRYINECEPYLFQDNNKRVVINITPVTTDNITNKCQQDKQQKFSPKIERYFVCKNQLQYLEKPLKF